MNKITKLISYSENFQAYTKKETKGTLVNYHPALIIKIVLEVVLLEFIHCIYLSKYK